MNEIDISLLRLKIDVQIHTAVLHSLIAATTLMKDGYLIQPTLRSALQDSTKNLTFPDMDPALSDMYVGEYQDAVARFLSAMKPD